MACLSGFTAKEAIMTGKQVKVLSDFSQHL